jgi:hypothetical protein
MSNLPAAYPARPVGLDQGDTAWDSEHEPVYYMAALEIVRRMAPDALITMHVVPSVAVPGARAAAFARWLFERYELFGVEPANLLAREDPEVRVARDPKGFGKPSGSGDVLALYLPHPCDLALNVDLAGYRCELWDLERRRPVVPAAGAGTPATVRASACEGDVLVLLAPWGGVAPSIAERAEGARGARRSECRGQMGRRPD